VSRHNPAVLLRNVILVALIGAVIAYIFLTKPERSVPALAEGGGTSVADSTDAITLFLAGDAIITQPWSHVQHPDFLRLVKEIRGADAAIVNLETPIHEYKGYAQAHSGGTHMAAPPKIAFELAWAGIDMVSHANNHTFDYGSIGVLETLENTIKADLILAGAGKDLQNARAPRYFETAKGTIALVAASSTFYSFNTASNTYPDMRGRPGLNPIGIHDRYLYIVVTVTPATTALMEKLAKSAGRTGYRFKQQTFKLFGIRFRVGEEHEIRFIRRGDFSRTDVEANLTAIRGARSNADVVIFSIHAHDQGDALTDLAHQVIDAGADIFFGHGPHEVRGIEIYKGKPIFYGLGDFVFQPGQVARYPAETYKQQGLGPETTLEELKQTKAKELQIMNYPTGRSVRESFAAVLKLSKEEVTELRLLPMDLQYGQPAPILGQPIYADGELGRAIIEETIQKSRRYGTKIDYLAGKNAGQVSIPTHP